MGSIIGMISSLIGMLLFNVLMWVATAFDNLPVWYVVTFLWLVSFVSWIVFTVKVIKEI